MSYLGPSLRRSARRANRTWRRVLVALALSLVVNALILLEAEVQWHPSKVTLAPARDVVLAPLSPSQWAANRSVGPRSSSSSSSSPPLAVAPPPQTPPPPPPRQMPGQVVDVAPSKNDAPPKDSRFVSERNNTVEKETRSRDARAGFENTLPRPSSPKAPAPPPPPQNDSAGAMASGAAAAKAGGKRGQGPRPGPAIREQPAMRGDAARDRLALAERGEQRNPLRPVPPTPRGGDGGASEKGDGKPKSSTSAEGDAAGGASGPLAHLDLRPSASAYDRLAGGPAPDRLEGVEEGDATYLNTREWKYSGYFNRIKQAVASQWDPSVSMTARDPSGARFSHRDWETLVMVRLDSMGVLKRVTVARGSGLEFLDRIAVEAFEKAQPFANPPPGLADERGEIVFSFGFYVQTGSSGMRVFRSRN